MNDEKYTDAPPAHTVRTPRLVVRCWTPADAPLLKETVDGSLEHLRPWMPWAHREPSPLDEVEERLETFERKFRNGEDWIYGIFDAEERRVIGGTGLHPRIGPGALEIGYWIGADAINRGYATEVSSALTRVGFEIAGVEHIEIRCDPANAASAAIPRKLGYNYITTLIGNVTDQDGIPRDSMVWTLTGREYPATPSAGIAIEAFDLGGARIL